MNTSTQPLSSAVMKTPIAAPYSPATLTAFKQFAIESLLNSLREIEMVLSLESESAIADGKKPSGDVLCQLELVGGLPEELYLVALKKLVNRGSLEDAKGAAWILQNIADLNSLEIESLAAHS